MIITDKRKKPDQSMVMMVVNVFVEPELNTVLKRLSKGKKKTRSTYIRCLIKDALRSSLSKIGKIDWSESNR